MENKMSKETFDMYQKIINSTVESHLKLTNYNTAIDKNDWQQSCWIAILETEIKEGRSPLEPAYVKTICDRKIKDLKRYGERRNAASLDYEVEDGTGDDDYRDVISDTYNDEEHNISNTMYSELMSYFPEDSKEKLYLKYWSEAGQLRDYGLGGYKAPKKGQKEYSKGDLALLLGFKGGTGDSRWKAFDKKMKDFVRDYYGFTQEQIDKEFGKK